MICKERPIIFSGPMVRAILEGSKTQTRRVMRPQPFLEKGKNGNWWLLDRSEDGYGCTNSAWEEGKEPFWTYCPYGQPGDRLWVRETWKQIWDVDASIGSVQRVAYRATEPDDKRLWKPAIHMRRDDSRLTLEIVKIRVQRVRDIQEQDAISEGVVVKVRELGALDPFKRLWDSINAKRGFGWDKNPWVWTITFKRVSA